MSSSENSASQRLFLALWPDTALRARIVDLTQALALPGDRLVVPENLHMTLVFLGKVEPTLRDCVETVAAELQQPRFTLTLDNLAYVARARMVWLASREVPDRLTSIVSQLRHGLGGCGIAMDQRGFCAHLTLARKLARVPRLPGITPLRWEVREFVLVQSRTYQEGAQYQVLQRWPLL